MDHLIYTIMNGADRLLQAQQVRAHNLANAGTPGFRADIEVATSQAVAGAGFDSAHMAMQQPSAVDTRSGTVIETGRDLDVAIQGEGFLTVATDRGEAYTRAGNLTVDAAGVLTINDRPVLGDDGPIILPPFGKIAIAADGMISIQALGDSAQEGLRPIDRLKLVKPLPQQLSKDAAGLLVTQLGETEPADETVRLLSGHLEHSNVLPIHDMIATMEIGRNFEIQMKMFNVANDMVDAGNRLIRG